MEFGSIVIYKYSTPLFDTFSFDLNSPISPMPLPEDTSTSNILVKMEGNSSQINFGWKIVPNEKGTLSKGIFDNVSGGILTSTALGAPLDAFDFVDGQSGAIDYDEITCDDSFIMMQNIFNKFESTSIKDSFAFNIYDDVEGADKFTRFGSISSLRGSVDPAAPTIWNVSLDFLIGHVISIYDADTSEIPTDFIITQGANGSGGVRTIQYSFKAPSRVGGSPILSYDLSWEVLNQGYYGSENVLVAALTLIGTTYTYTLTLTGITAANKVKAKVSAKNSGGGGTPATSAYIDLT